MTAGAWLAIALNLVLWLGPDPARLATVSWCRDCPAFLSCGWEDPECVYDWVGGDFVCTSGVITLTCRTQEDTIRLFRLDWRQQKAGTVLVAWKEERWP